MKSTQLREAIDKGNDARRAGHLSEALAHYRTALDLAPEHPEACSLLGLVELHRGNIPAAEPLLRKAVASDPENIAYRMNLALLFESTQHWRAAATEYQTVCQLAPGFPRARERLGDLMMRTDRPADALGNYQRAASLEPHDHVLKVKCAQALFRLGRVDDARRLLDVALPRHRPMPLTFQLYAEVLRAQADWKALESAARLWIGAYPSDPDAWQALTAAMFETGRLREAMELHRNVLQHGGRDARRLTVYAQYCLNVSELALADAALSEAEQLDPNDVELLATKALLLTYLGRLGEAEAYSRRAIAQAPHHILAYRVLNQLRRGRLTTEERATLATLAQRNDLNLADRMAATFFHADALDAEGAFDNAFKAYQEANNLGLERAKREGISYSAHARTRRVENLLRLFASRPQRRSHEVSSLRPVFVVGMPRSGTTLFEMILGAHSRVLACGERTVMPQILANFLDAKVGLDEISNDQWDNWVRAYWYDLPNAGRADHATDKNPFNFESAGLVASLFPDAQIIHVRRNPVETGLSIFRNELPKHVTFANRLEDIGHYYGCYARLVSHWERTLGTRFLTVQYEDLVADPKAIVGKMLAACRLEWEAECLNFADMAAPATTLSAVQVRRGLHAPELRASTYAKYTAPLFQALETAGVDVVTGSLTRPATHG